MAIEFVCPSCGQVLKLRDEAAGKRGRCPHCKSVITVPETAVSEDDLIEIIPSKPPAPRKPPAAPVKPPVPTPSDPPTAREQEPPPFARSAFAEASADEPAPAAPVAPAKPVEPPKPEGKTCPGCGGALAEGAVICVKCGFNLKTGKKLQTVFEEPEPEPEPEKPAETGKPETPEG